MIPHERETPLHEARQRIERELASQHIGWLAVPHGKTLRATVVYLHDADGDPLCTGVGKGDDDTALVGGLFEAFEHHMSLHHSASADHVLLPACSVPTGLGAPLDALLAAQPDTMIACRRYVDVIDGRSVAYPLALSRPTYIDTPAQGDRFDYSGLCRYATNSGTAIGSTFAEAALHALNECIERDDLSHFLRIHFHDQADVPLRLVDRTRMNETTAEMWRVAGEEIGHDIVVVDISMHTAAHTFLAFAMAPAMPVHVYGTGSSADDSHAVQRALSELVQVTLMARTAPSVAHDLARGERALRRWPRLHRGCVADLPSLHARCRQVVADIQKISTPHTIHAQWEYAARRITEEGYRPLVHTIHADAQGSTLCQVLVPGFDRYHLVAHGNVVAPGFRRQAEQAHA